MIKKLLAVCDAGISDFFILWSDTQYLLQSIHASTLSRPSHNGDAGTWTEEQWQTKLDDKETLRLRNTVELLQRQNESTWNFETQHPVLYDRDEFKTLMTELDILNEGSGPRHGYAINTLYCNLAGRNPSLSCPLTKNTHFWSINESTHWPTTESKLSRLFPQPVKWEKDLIFADTPRQEERFYKKCFAFAFNESFIKYAAVLAHSIIVTNPDYDICCLTTNIQPEKLNCYPFNHSRVKILPEFVDIPEANKVIRAETDRNITGEACYMNTIRFKRVRELFAQYELIFLSDADAIVEKKLDITEKNMSQKDIGFVSNLRSRNAHYKIRAFWVIFNLKNGMDKCLKFLESWDVAFTRNSPAWFNDQLSLLYAFRQNPDLQYFYMSKKHYCNYSLKAYTYILGTSTGTKMGKLGYKNEFERITKKIEKINQRNSIAPYTVPITAITCTGDRPVQFGICLKIMRRINPRPAQWLIVDDGQTPIAPELIPPWAEYIRRERRPGDPSMTLAKNILAGFEHLKHDTVAFIEDDDWYPENYLDEQLKEVQGYEACGTNRRKFFQLKKNTARHFHGTFPITASLLLNSQAAIEAYRQTCFDNPHGNGLDGIFWRDFSGKKKMHDNPEASSVGFKDWAVGRGPGYAPCHISTRHCVSDPKRKNLKMWLSEGEDQWYLPEFLDEIKIGVIIPVYNSAPYLPELFDSLKKQTLQPSQIIVIDDGSANPDETAEMCKSYGITCKLRPHGGACAARNYGESCLAAEINFLFFADSDIILDSSAFNRMAEMLKQHPQVGYCYPNFYVGNFFCRWNTFDGEALKRKNYITMCALLRRRIFKPMDERLRILEDWELWLRLYLQHGIQGIWLDYPAFISRIRPGRVSDSGAKVTNQAKAYIRKKLLSQ